jgi:osmotically-inducible protein OsmY
MNPIRSLCILRVVLGAITVMSGCTSFRQCDSDACAGDSKITSDVQSRFNEMLDFGPPGSIQVKTIDRVVFLNGEVVGGLSKRLAESVATEAPGVLRVVNAIDVEHE